MNFIRIIFKTYILSLLLSGAYLLLIHQQFEPNELGFVMLALLIGNGVLSVSYTIGILLPFSFIFKYLIEANEFKLNLNKLLIYFSLLPFILIVGNVTVLLEHTQSGIQFSILVFAVCSINYLGFIHLLKIKSVQ